MPWRISIPYQSHATHDAGSLAQGVQSISPRQAYGLESACEDAGRVIMDEEWELVPGVDQTDFDGMHAPSVQSPEALKIDDTNYAKCKYCRTPLKRS